MAYTPKNPHDFDALVADNVALAAENARLRAERDAMRAELERLAAVQGGGEHEDQEDR